ncbi:MAG: hypothetical protein AAFS10_08670 [Myxococcota bacterium]
MKATTIALRIAAILWVVWGLVHMFAGVVTMINPTPQAVAGIADAVDPATLLDVVYPDAAGALINQHGWNLAWGGLVTVICAPFVWKGDARGIFLAALVGGLLDIGYFIFLDLGGYVHFVPGTVMTIFSGSAIVLSFYAHFASQGEEGSASTPNTSNAG